MQLFRITMGAAMAAIPDANKRRTFYEKVSKAFSQHDPSFELGNYGGIDEELDAVIEAHAQRGADAYREAIEPPVYESKPPPGNTSDSGPERRPGPYGRNEPARPDAFRGSFTETGRTSSREVFGRPEPEPTIVATAPDGGFGSHVADPMIPGTPRTEPTDPAPTGPRSGFTPPAAPADPTPNPNPRKGSDK